MPFLKNEFQFKSPAKLNLFLKIKNKRKDGFHNLETIFERISLCDDIIVKIRNCGKIRVSCDKRISCQKSNLAYKAAELIKEKFKIKEGIDIRIKKRIPIGRGLGGGSSNAATVLLALNKIFKLYLSEKKLIEFAKVIGSDVPFFVLNKSFAKAGGRGEKLIPIFTRKKVKFWHILIAPNFRNLTKDMYRRFDDYLRLTKNKANDKIKCPKKNLFNSFEFIAGPQITRIKDRLTQLNVKYALMSGSGSAVFGILHSRKEAGRLCRQLQKEHLGQVFVATTY